MYLIWRKRKIGFFISVKITGNNKLINCANGWQISDPSFIGFIPYIYRLEIKHQLYVQGTKKLLQVDFMTGIRTQRNWLVI